MAKAKPQFEKYGIKWHAGTTPLAIEFYCIRNHVQWGLDLFTHYRNAQSLAWPEEDHHRWSDLALRHAIAERITIAMGPKDAGKTHTWAKFALIDYWVYPQTTLWLISS